MQEPYRRDKSGVLRRQPARRAPGARIRRVIRRCPVHRGGLGWNGGGAARQVGSPRRHPEHLAQRVEQPPHRRRRGEQHHRRIGQQAQLLWPGGPWRPGRGRARPDGWLNAGGEAGGGPCGPHGHAAQSSPEQEQQRRGQHPARAARGDGGTRPIQDTHEAFERGRRRGKCEMQHGHEQK
jgi:hypothetical protein